MRIITTMTRSDALRGYMIWPARTAVVIAAALVLSGCFGVAVGQTSKSIEEPNSQADDILISPGDVLNITVFDTPEFTGAFRVSNGGSLYLPLIDKVQVAGQSTSNAAALIRQRLIEGNFIKDPQVVVSISDLVGHHAIVLGEVLRPGEVPIPGLYHLRDVVAACGGVTAQAGDHVVITRGESMLSPETIDVAWDKPLASQPNPIIRPGDTVQISRAGIIYVAGEVYRQAAIQIAHDQIMLSQVITLADGVKPTAKSTRARLVRTIGNSRTVTQINIASILKGDSPDIPLRDGDLIYVPNSKAKAAISRGIDLAIAMSTTFLVYVATQ